MQETLWPTFKDDRARGKHRIILHYTCVFRDLQMIKMELPSDFCEDESFSGTRDDANPHHLLPSHPTTPLFNRLSICLTDDFQLDPPQLATDLITSARAYGAHCTDENCCLLQ